MQQIVGTMRESGVTATAADPKPDSYIITTLDYSRIPPSVRVIPCNLGEAARADLGEALELFRRRALTKKAIPVCASLPGSKDFITTVKTSLPL